MIAGLFLYNPPLMGRKKEEESMLLPTPSTDREEKEETENMEDKTQTS